MDPNTLKIKDYTYSLPKDRIAEFPLMERDASKLLVYNQNGIQDELFVNLSDHVPDGALIVLNDTRVIEARILFRKATGAVIEVFCLRPYLRTIEESLGESGKTQWLCLIGGASKWKPGQSLQKSVFVRDESVLLTARYLSKEEDGFIIEFSWQSSAISFSEVLHAAGQIPLPPYIKRTVQEMDQDRYQTIFSKKDGSVAAPTASLHFTDAVFKQLQLKNIRTCSITLHVGAGTFKPVKSETIGGHLMHAEPFSVQQQSIEALLNSSLVIAAGTTTLRTLESLYWIGIKLIQGKTADLCTVQQWEAYELDRMYPDIPFHKSMEALLQYMHLNNVDSIYCNTSLLIVPGYRFRTVHGLITNFHQPESTLLMLVAAFTGNNWKNIYSHALENGYRFLSYGDSSLLWRSDL